jgi:hypothetical protein
LLYARRKSLALDARIVGWTLLAVVASREVAVNRETAELTLRHHRTDGALLWQQHDALLPDSAAGEVAP